jgi:hypothetical protein
VKRALTYDLVGPTCHANPTGPKMNASLRRAAFVLALGLGVAAHAQERLNVTWTEDVGRAVRFLGVEVGPPSSGQRIVSLTYQALRPCKRLSLSGHSVSKDGIKLARFELTSGKSNVRLEQKFRDTAVVVYDEGHHLIVDEVSCL